MAQLFFCLLALIQVIPLGWFGCSVLGYVLGRLIYFVLLQLHTQPIYNPITPPQNITPQPKHLAKPTVKESVSPEQKLLDDFFKLQFQVGDLLPATANAKFQDIHALIIVLVQKFKRTQDFNMQNEILKIQSVIKNYLAPTIKNYQELPVFFLDRKIDNRGGPTCLNN
ncbi:hypothetical protein DJ533_07070 [Acinetobacter defluvii]|uniref:Uncharacterized protein n=1 Tax=Acinetobacter defluvii TaxID=1871111 RepID=A0A2S2FBI8_9GAMM|nr:hypothetical protein [Acinetobacter defluvii]AWL28346.1 hypothetical protein DJ533_07070 [Acinetobacter defluvii]